MVWPGQGGVRAETTSEIDTAGYYTRAVRMPEHSGAHLDAPAHFDPGGRTADRIPVGSLVAPCAVLDVSERCEGEPEVELDAEGIEALEAQDRRIESGDAVLVATGWDRHRGDAERYLGGREEGALRFPGVGPSGAKLLIERGAVGLGIDTASVDPGRAADFPNHNLTLPAGLWHLECLVNLTELPARDALLVVGVLPLVDGSGAPARVLALLP